MTELQKIFTGIQKEISGGNFAALQRALRPLLAKRVEYYRQSLREGNQYEYADALYKILLLDMDDDDDASVELAELAYLSLCDSLSHPGNHDRQYKARLLLLSDFSDNLTDSVACACFPQQRRTNLLQARQIALECIEKMQVTDILYLEENCPEILDEDEKATAACSFIKTDINLSPAEREDALLLHKIFYAYLKIKYKQISGQTRPTE